MIIYVLIALATFFVMEFIAWAMHKYIMHKWLWYLHEDHHRKSPGFFEKNDAFFLIFAVPSWLCIMLGSMNGAYVIVSIGAGIAAYGLAYFFIHDIIIHQRFKIFTRSNNTFIRVVRWAHKMHHKHINKENGESFGMLIVKRKYWNKVKNDEQRYNQRSTLT